MIISIMLKELNPIIVAARRRGILVNNILNSLYINLPKKKNDINNNQVNLII